MQGKASVRERREEAKYIYHSALLHINSTFWGAEFGAQIVFQVLQTNFEQSSHVCQ